MPRVHVHNDELLSKLDLIEEQARRTMDEITHQRAKERQLMIIALVKHIRWAATDSTPVERIGPEATVRLSS